jgi:hypothetical protein
MIEKRSSPGSRITREKKTLKFMIDLYCRKKHGGKEFCPECMEVSEYAGQRLEKCLFGEKKPVCGKCKVHCYKPDMREKIRGIMKYSGPRMALRHPVLALLHFMDSNKSAAHAKSSERA